MPTTKATSSGIDGGSDGTNGHGPPRPEVPTAKIGMWLFAASLAMLFAGLASMYGYRLSDKPNYFFPWPPSLWVSTIAIVVSTLTLYISQRNAKKGLMERCRLYLGLTLALGWVFFLSQLVAWLLLRHAGFYATSNPISGLFYILTTVHAFHMLIGIGWLIYVFYLAKHHQLSAKRHMALELFAVYWHLMTAVWLVFFALILI